MTAALDSNNLCPLKKRHMARTAHKPTVETRKLAEGAAIAGIPQPTIAKALGITKPTLTKHYGDELRNGAIGFKAEIGNAMADGVRDRQPAMVIFAAKARLGWSEKQREIDDLKAQLADLEDRMTRLGGGV